MSVLKAFRLPEILASQLKKIAHATNRSEKFYVEQALRHYFDSLADAQIAKDRFNDPKSKIISGKELKARLNV